MWKHADNKPTALRIDDRVFTIRCKAHTRRLLMCKIVFKICKAGLFIATKYNAYLSLWFKAKLFKGDKRIETGIDGAFIVKNSPAVHDTVYNFSSKRLMRPSRSCRHHIQMSNCADILLGRAKRCIPHMIADVFRSKSKLRGINERLCQSFLYTCSERSFRHWTSLYAVNAHNVLDCANHLRHKCINGFKNVFV